MRAVVQRPLVQAVALGAVCFAALGIRGPLSYDGYVVQLIAVYAIAAMGVNIITGYAGVLTLGQGASFAVGAYVAGVLAANHGWPIWATLPAAFAVGLVIGAVAGIPAVRLGAIGLAMISLGLVLVVNDLVVEFRSVTGGNSGVSGIGAVLTPGGTPLSSLWVVPAVIVVLAALTYWLHARYRISRLGRATVAARDEPIGATALGIRGYRTKVYAFAVGSALGALSGALYAYLSAYISPDAFSPSLSILLLVMVVLGGSGSLVGPVVGAIVLTVVPINLEQYPHVNVIVYGVLLVVLTALRPRGLFSRSAAPAPGAIESLNRDTAGTGPLGTPPEQRYRGKGGDTVLTVADVERSFAGVRALAGVSFELREGEILGLIGPNGSGKTTMLNVVCGHYPPDGGRILLGDTLLNDRSPAAIADLGVGRTFQTPKTFPGLSVEEHLTLPAAPPDVPAARRDACLAGARELLRLGDLRPDDPAALRRESRVLSHGQLRFLEAAMALIACPRVLLLDEPAAGLSHTEIEGFERVVADVAAGGVAVVIVEHHLDMIARLVDRTVVLDLGTVLWEGRPEEMHDVESVRAAYMGIA